MKPLTADVQAAASALLAAATWLADLNHFLQMSATVVAIVAGVAAAWYHFERAVALRKKRLNDTTADKD